MAEISSVLYWTVLQWAGYPRDKKVAHLQFMLERDGKMPEFEKPLHTYNRALGACIAGGAFVPAVS